MNAFNSAEVLPKRVGVPNMIPSVHSTSACVGTPNFRHHRCRNDIRSPAEADFGPSLTGSFTDSFSKGFHRAVTRVEHDKNVGFRVHLKARNGRASSRAKNNKL